MFNKETPAITQPLKKEDKRLSKGIVNIEKLDEECKNINCDISEIKKEAKLSKIDSKVINFFMKLSDMSDEDKGLLEEELGLNLKPVAKNEKLNSFVERITRLKDEINDINTDKKEIFTDLQNDGFDKKIAKDMIKFRKMTEDERNEMFDLQETYAEQIELKLW